MAISGHASQAATLAVIFTSSALAIIAVVLRLWTRLLIVRQPGWDDLLVTLSLFFTVIFTVCVFFEVYYGLGTHIETISKHDLTQLCLWLWISVWNYYIGPGLAKLSIVVQCMRIFGHIKWFRTASYILAAIITAFTIFSTFISIFPSCIDRLPLWLFNSAFTMLTDIAVTVLPLPVLKSLQLPARQRYILMGVFGLGGVICIVSIVRLSGIYATSVAKDVSWENSQAALYSNLEAAVGIIASCVPTLRAFVKTYFPKLFTSASAGSDGTELSDFSGGYDRMKAGPVRIMAGELETEQRADSTSKRKVMIEHREREPTRMHESTEELVPVVTRELA
ncbi:hypothetical protein PRZ48_010067 [Zasmidium cellare]|uniref:Rhodopsin domain-containing protein n=1 Tax=Zasmidium cellare TaxID=395010 RepID=A0ABR0EE69_ZASCE|nr:hypothetical protein PRZ48_010067 [Zasmidium cellare]